jgi:hypothetical protein
MKAVGMFAGGISAYDSGKYTRRVMDTNRQNALNAGVMQRDRIRESARMAIGQQLVAQGGSGAGVGTGSALDALHASAINREMDLALSRAGASAQAGDYARKGFMAYQQGKAALSAGIISGAAEIASEVAGAMGGCPAAAAAAVETRSSVTETSPPATRRRAAASSRATSSTLQ